jgi:hypothetical protein
MKIDTSSPRIPLHRLKHPVKESLHPSKGKANVVVKEESSISEEFERALLQKGAKKFNEWLKKFEIK